MTAPVVTRPETGFNAKAHAYTLEGWDHVLGVSTIAKVGGVEKAFDVASKWGFRLGYEGAFALLAEAGVAGFSVTYEGWEDKRKVTKRVRVDSPDAMREALIGRGMAPWSKRDAAADRGSWVHDGLEELGQEGAVPDMAAFAVKHGEEASGHMRSVLAWFLHFRPRFVAMEVQVSSVRHGFAGRYDVRALIDARLLLACIDPLRDDAQAERVRELAAAADAAGLPLYHLDACALCLVDLKTSKGIYPETHFPQLEGYEGAGVEMGFPATDARCVLNTWPTGEHEPARDFAVSWSTYEDFLAFAPALRAIRRIAEADPERKRKRAREAAIVAQLPARSRDIAAAGLPELAGMDAKAIGRVLGGLRKRGKVVQHGQGLWALAVDEGGG